MFFDFPLQVAGDGGKLAAVGKAAQVDGGAGASGAAAAADAVHVVFDLARQVVVDDVADGWHVYAARGNVGCDQDVAFAFAQVFDDAVAFDLRQVAVQVAGAEAVVTQAVGDFFAGALGGGEDDCLSHLRVGNEVLKDLVFVFGVVAEVDFFFDMRAFDFDGDALRLARVAARDFAYCAVPGGG